MMIPNSTEEARLIGKKLSYKEILLYWEEYKRSLSNEKMTKAILKKAFREQMLRETVEGYLGINGHRSLSRDQIEKLLIRSRGRRILTKRGKLFGNLGFPRGDKK